MSKVESVIMVVVVLLGWWLHLYVSHIYKYIAMDAVQTTNLTTRIADLEAVTVLIREEQLRRTKAVEAASREFLEKDESVANDSDNICILETDVLGNILNCSDSIIKIMGYTDSDVIGRNVRIFMSKDDAKNHDAYFSNTFKLPDGSLCSREIQAIDKDGNAVKLFMTITKYTSKSGSRYTVLLKAR